MTETKHVRRPMAYHHRCGAWLAALLLAAAALITVAPTASALSLPFQLYLPVPAGATVSAGGPHPFNGSSTGTRSSVDLGAGGAALAVTAAAGGTVTVGGANGFSRCYVYIQHPDGWQTRYYHLINIPTGLVNGQSVSAGQVIGAMGMPGVDTCGSGTFRHVHFAVYRNGVEQAIDSTSIGGYTVHQTGSAYCGYWTRDADGAIVADARTACMAVPSLVNNRVLPGQGVSDGSFVRATDNGEVYRIAGGAPIYVSSWTPFGGSKPYVDLSRAQINALPQYPRDGTFVNGASSGRVYRFAGGAPLYVSTWASYGGGQPTIAVDDFTLDRPDQGSPLNHVHRYPANGTFISNTADGRVYRVAGGAPLYVQDWAKFGGPKPTTSIDPWEFSQYQHLRPVPTDMFLRGVPSGRVFRVVNNGHPYYVPSWDPYGGTQPYLDVDDWAIDNCDHVDCGPFGNLDAATGGAGRVTVAGWSIDPNAVGTATGIHVYVGGPAGSSAAQGIDAGYANRARTDVDKAYPGTGSNHGYTFNLFTTKRGTQPVYVYGINVPGTKGGHTLLGQGTVTIGDPNPYTPLTPARLLDTRTGLGAPTGKVAGGGTVDLQITGRGGIPTSGVSAVVLNLTVTGPTGAGTATVYPTGTTRPTATALSYPSGATIADQVLATVGTGGKVSIRVSATTHLVADVAGYYTTTGMYAPAGPVRIVDTRSGLGAPKARLAAGGTLPVTVTGKAGVPANASAVILHVTALNETAGGYVTAYPGGTTRPTASNINYRTSSAITGMVLAKVGAGGVVNLFSSSATDLLVDVSGWIPSGADYTALAPTRQLDTRTSTGGHYGKLAAREAVKVKVTGVGGVPATGVKAVMVNVTVTGPTAGGYVTVFPGGTRPTASNLNYATGQTIANSVVAKVATDGTITAYTSSSTHLIVDISGYWTG